MNSDLNLFDDMVLELTFRLDSNSTGKPIEDGHRYLGVSKQVIPSRNQSELEFSPLIGGQPTDADFASAPIVRKLQRDALQRPSRMHVHDHPRDFTLIGRCSVGCDHRRSKVQTSNGR